MSRRLCTSIGACALLIILPGTLEACAPILPDRLLVDADGFVQEAPVADFAVEITRSTAGVKPRFKAVVPPPGPFGEAGPEQYRQQTVQVDVADLRDALRPLTSARERALGAYRAARAALMKAPPVGAKGHTPFVMSPLPADIPAEFAEYLRGAVLYREGKRAEARDEWLHLLARPPRERHYRSTWAAFMIGRSYQEADPAEAATWFTRVRQLAAEGYADRLGLAAASLGWEAQTHLARQQYQQAFRLYAEQAATGDPTASLSLATAAQQALKGDTATLTQLAADAVARRVITAYLISWGGPFVEGPQLEVSRRWAAVIAGAQVFPAEDADRLAWAAYQAGEMDLARQWLGLAGNTPEARWLRAKLLVRAGQMKEASAALAALARDFPPRTRTLDSEWADQRNGGDGPWRLDIDAVGDAVRGDLGVLLFARGQYSAALDTLLKGGFWEDAAYVAEDVLSPDELKAYVDQAWPPAPDSRVSLPVGEVWLAPQGVPTRANIRHLLARRLARAGRRQEARAYFPPNLRPGFDEFTKAMAEGQDARRSAHRRAEALWHAARILHRQGMALLGTELSPDWAVYAGDYSEETYRQRPGQLRLAGASRLAPFTPEEARRLRSHVPSPNLRFHYRYTAADLAWQAAQLMPDQSDQTARVLAVAGTWLKNWDPDAADRFYKALVQRCGRTTLGKEAARLHWFPPHVRG